MKVGDLGYRRWYWQASNGSHLHGALAWNTGGFQVLLVMVMTLNGD